MNMKNQEATKHLEYNQVFLCWKENNFNPCRLIILNTVYLTFSRSSFHS